MSGQEKGGAGIWFLKKLITAPAVWLGALAGSGVAYAMAGKTPLGGMIGFGSMVGIVVALIAFGATAAISSAYRSSRNKDGKDSVELAILEELETSGLGEGAELLRKMTADRDAVVARCSDRTEDADAIHTRDLVNAIVEKSFRQAEELQDLERRNNDPLLEAQENADQRISSLRKDLTYAYQAVANARSRLRKGEHLDEIDFLESSENLGQYSLSDLAKQLEEETIISRRVDQRMQPDYQSGIVIEDSPESSSEDELESA